MTVQDAVGVDTSGLEVVPVETERQVQLMRMIRNTARGQFCHDNEEIGPEQQRAWWASMQGRIKAWLYYHYSRQETGLMIVAGYGLLRQTEDGRWWNSLAVMPQFRRRGYGSSITADLARRHDGPVYASVRADNAAALAMHHRADWQELGRSDDGLVHFRSVTWVSKQDE